MGIQLETLLKIDHTFCEGRLFLLRMQVGTRQKSGDGEEAVWMDVGQGGISRLEILNLDLAIGSCV